MNHEKSPLFHHRLCRIPALARIAVVRSLVAGFAFHACTKAADLPAFPVTSFTNRAVFNLTASQSYPSLAAPVQTPSRGSVNLKWDASKDLSVAGYRVYFGTNAGNYLQSSAVGLRTNVTINGLLEGMKYFFVVVAHDAIGAESPFSNEVSTTTGFYVSIQQRVWQVESVGGFGKTNMIQTTTNLQNWMTSLTWIGNGKMTNIWHTNIAQSWFRVVAK